jgi:ABC-type sugar transport system permease subunit
MGQSEVRWTRNLDELPRLIVKIFFIVCGILGFAIIYALMNSFWEFPMRAILRLFGDSIKLKEALYNTLYIFMISFVIQALLVFLLTISIHRVSPLIKILLVVPYATGVLATAFSFYVFLSPALGPFDDINILGKHARLIIALVDAWQWSGILLLACYFKLEKVPDSHFEQARLEGISRFRAWRVIVLPEIIGVVSLFFLIRLLDWLRKIDVVKVLYNQGGPGYIVETIGMYIHQNYYFINERSYAALLALIQLILLGFLLVLVFRYYLSRRFADGE